MGLLDRLRRRPLLPDDVFAPMPGFRIAFDEETRFTADLDVLRLMRDGIAQRSAQEQFIVLDMLAEEGRATPVAEGFVVPADVVAQMDDDEATILGLPPRFSGEIRTAPHKWTSSPDFRVDVVVRTGMHPEPYERRGPAISVAGSLSRLSPPALQALRSLEAHAALSPPRRTDARNVQLVAELQDARNRATSSTGTADHDTTLALGLGPLDKFSTTVPRSVGLTVEQQQDGSLAVTPDLGPTLDPDDVRRRLGQLPRDDAEAGVLRVGDQLVLLDRERLAGVKEVLRRPWIAPEQVQQFFDAPGAFYDPEVVDVEVHLGVRVLGLGVIAPVSFTEAAERGIGWFDDVRTATPPEVLRERPASVAEHRDLTATIEQAWERGETVVPLDDAIIDVSDRDRVTEALDAARERLERLGNPSDSVSETSDPAAGDVVGGTRVTVGMHIADLPAGPDELRLVAEAARPTRPVDYASLALDPYPHQRSGIEWMTALMQAAASSDPEDPRRVRGALLADDMGLGKTFMTLVALRELIESVRAGGREPGPVLAVMPVALLDNWLAEIEKAFGTRTGPFSEVVPLQGEGLGLFRIRGRGRETAAGLDDLDAHGMVREDRLADLVSLRVGDAWGDARLDRPGTLVLTTYEALRRHQVSLGLVEWEAVVLDEAQNVKNPETLSSRAAKALKTRFLLAATGTPVENSLLDFWNLVDTAQPGLLGSWAQFRDDWETSMHAASGEEHARLGKALRDEVGPFMLRRIKEDHLPGLPPKHVHSLRRAMPTAQRQAYDEVLAGYRARKGVKGAALATLHALSEVSLHPWLRTGAAEVRDVRAVDESARTLTTVREILDEIRARDEKAIVFCRTKAMQRVLAGWLGELYGLRVDVVNGDTSATGATHGRLARIRAFEARQGFNVIVLSPLAVGVGLTVVGANHAIHLERHWNPAKEAQATDRVYRIGQKRDVHVYYPIATHPDVDSFDVNLDNLLRSKTTLRDAVVVPEASPEEVMRAMGLV